MLYKDSVITHYQMPQYISTKLLKSYFPSRRRRRTRKRRRSISRRSRRRRFRSRRNGCRRC